MARRRHRSLGALKAGCEIHTFADGSRKKACMKKKPSDKAVKAWRENLKTACANAPDGLKEACKAVKSGKKKAAKKKKAKKGAK